jgi:hypothetical protein
MKKHLLIVFLLPLISSAQNYHPLLDSTNTWTFVMNQLAVSPENTDCYYPFIPSQINGYLETTIDTTINLLSYKKLTQESMCTFGYIREDTSARKVFFVNKNFDQEELLYDFSMMPGDSISLAFDQNTMQSYWKDGYYVLDSIHQIPTYQGMRQAYYLNCHSSNNSHTLEWIEGIGNLANPVYTYNMNEAQGGLFISCNAYQHSFDYFLICFQHNQIQYFDSCSYSIAMVIVDSCHFYIPSSGIAGQNEQGLISIMSDANSVQLKTAEDMNESALTLFDYSGKEILSRSFENHSILLERSSFAKGIYIYQVSGNGKLITGKISF